PELESECLDNKEGSKTSSKTVVNKQGSVKKHRNDKISNIIDSYCSSTYNSPSFVLVQLNNFYKEIRELEFEHINKTDKIVRESPNYEYSQEKNDSNLDPNINQEIDQNKNFREVLVKSPELCKAHISKTSNFINKLKEFEFLKPKESNKNFGNPFNKNLGSSSDKYKSLSILEDLETESNQSKGLSLESSKNSKNITLVQVLKLKIKQNNSKPYNKCNTAIKSLDIGVKKEEG
ncbi:17211_t:CDS:2, partial [Racocetra persica]